MCGCNRRPCCVAYGSMNEYLSLLLAIVHILVIDAVSGGGGFQVSPVLVVGGVLILFFW